MIDYVNLYYNMMLVAVAQHLHACFIFLTVGEKESRFRNAIVVTEVQQCYFCPTLGC